LLQQYDSLESIYEHLDELPQSPRAKLDAERDTAFLSRALGRIVTEVPGIELDLDACRTQEFDREKVLGLFRELEFRSLYNRIPGGERQPPEAPAAGVPPRTGIMQISLFPTAEPAVETAEPPGCPVYPQAGIVSPERFKARHGDYQLVSR
jgi:DNA polymerase-1